MADVHDLDNGVGQYLEMIDGTLLQIKALKIEEIKQMKIANKLKVIELEMLGKLNNSKKEELKKIELEMKE